MEFEKDLSSFSKFLNYAITSVSQLSILGWGMVFLYVALNSFGALMLKSQIQKLGTWNFSSLYSYFFYFLALLSSWQTWIALVAIFGSIGAWIIALAHLDLSRAYPVAIALNLLIILSLSILYNHEALNYSKILGILLICSGVVALFR